MTQIMTRNKVQILLMPYLKQTAAQSPGSVNADLEQTEAQSHLEPASLREREREKLQGKAADESVPDVPEARESKRLHRGRPADSEVQGQVNKDGPIQQKDCAQQQVKRKLRSAERRARKGKSRRNSASRKSVGRTRVQCKRESQEHT